jgi:hypothetical protein
MFCFVFFGIIRLQETFKNILWAERLSGSPQYGYSLAQLARFGFRFSKHFLFCLIWDYKTSRDIQKKMRAGLLAGNPKFAYSLAQLARFGFRFFNFFLFCLIWDYKTLRDIRKKMRAGRSAGTPQSWYSLAQLARFGFRVSKHFLFCLIWDYKTSGDLQKYFVSWEIIRKCSIWIFPGTTGSFWVQILQTFFVLSYLGL